MNESQSRIQGRILEVKALTERISEFHIGVKESALPSYKAGAHVLFDVKGGETRAYSLISFSQIPSEPDVYCIAVQREPEGEGGSQWMHRLQSGDEISFTPPKNDFQVNTETSAVLLAGGIGITPIISMASELEAAGQDFSVHYSGRSAGLMAYADILSEQFGERFARHCDDDASALDLGVLINDLGDADLYVCGPRGMIDAARVRAEAAGIASERIHFELFEAAKQDAGDTTFEIEINDGQVFSIPPGKSIIDVLEENDVDVMYDCQRGDCGICQCDVLEGTPDHRDVVLSDAERAAGDIMQICVSRALSPRLKLDI